MRQNPVGEPAATAALNFGTPHRRNSLKRFGPFFHCRQETVSQLKGDEFFDNRILEKG
ncbi:MAG TPA: hypothetical protein VIK21_03350 [Desulfuromonadaceae bacterium]